MSTKHRREKFRVYRKLKYDSDAEFRNKEILRSKNFYLNNPDRHNTSYAYNSEPSIKKLKLAMPKTFKKLDDIAWKALLKKYLE